MMVFYFKRMLRGEVVILFRGVGVYVGVCREHSYSYIIMHQALLLQYWALSSRWQ